MDIVCKILYDITVYTKIIGTLEKWNFHKVGFKTNPVSKIVEKTVCMSVFLATWKRTPPDCFFGDFAHWEGPGKSVTLNKLCLL